MGAVLHTLNIRLFPEQLTYIVNHAEDKVILVDASLVPMLEPLAAELRDRRALRRRRRRRPRRAARTRDRSLRGAAAAGIARLRLPGARRAQRARPLLHERHDRQPEGRRSTRTARTSCTRWRLPGRRARRLARRPRAAGGADVPRQRLGPAVRGGLVGADLVLPSRFLQAEPLARLIEAAARDARAARARRSGSTCCATPTSTGPTSASLRMVRAAARRCRAR